VNTAPIKDNPMSYRWLLTILYGLFVIWTGLQRSIEAQQFKPNSFWFCLTTGLLAIAAGYLFKPRRCWPATMVALLSTVPVRSFYLHCFITQPDKDATHRVGLVIIASIAELIVITLPRAAPKTA